MVDAALRLIDRGDFQLKFEAIACESGRSVNALRHWGSMSLFMRDLARTRAPEIAAAVRKNWPGIEAKDDKALAWLVLVGKPRD